MNDEQQIIEPVPTMAGYKKIPTFKLWIANQFPYIEADYDAITNYELLQAVIKYLNTIIENENNVESNVTALYNSFVNLHDYVENFFDNLDVQEEVNNKLDKMVEDGTIESILLNYASLIKVYNTVATMKADANLKSGMYVKTRGYYDSKDGNGNEYIIREKTNEDVVDEVTIINITDTIIAELVITPNMTVDNFGAKANGTDDSLAFNTMLSKTRRIVTINKEYAINSTINLNTATLVDIKGIINYTGNSYAFELNNKSYFNFYIKQIYSATGGGINFHPTQNSQYISYGKIKLDYAVTKLNTLNFDATNGAVTLIDFDGIRWRSEDENVMYLFIGENAYSNTFLTEINVNNVDLWCSRKGIVALNNSSNVEIQFNLFKLNLENCRGIETTGRVTAIKIIDCRTDEIVNVDGWLTINDFLPNIELMGEGLLYPQKIHFNNLTSATDYNQIVTNLKYVDSVTTYNYEGGGIITRTNFYPFIEKTPEKEITDVGEFSLPAQNKDGGLYSRYVFTGNSWIQVTLGKGYNKSYVDIRIVNTISFIFATGVSTITIDNARGNYRILLTGRQILGYIKLS